mmetsp:Transcript_100642/g.324794  ORF Transcript_100642/g.324794 Transcript_100642/m.324794 type:complete len:107 (-) Transcript_100642:27-347(-)
MFSFVRVDPCLTRGLVLYLPTDIECVSHYIGQEPTPTVSWALDIDSCSRQECLKVGSCLGGLDLQRAAAVRVGGIGASWNPMTRRFLSKSGSHHVRALFVKRMLQC